MIQQADSKPGEQRLEELRKTRIDSVEHKALEKQTFLEQQKGAILRSCIYIYISYYTISQICFCCNCLLEYIFVYTYTYKYTHIYIFLPLYVFDVHFPLSTEAP